MPILPSLGRPFACCLCVYVTSAMKEQYILCGVGKVLRTDGRPDKRLVFYNKDVGKYWIDMCQAYGDINDRNGLKYALKITHTSHSQKFSENSRHVFCIFNTLYNTWPLILDAVNEKTLQFWLWFDAAQFYAEIYHIVNERYQSMHKLLGDVKPAKLVMYRTTYTHPNLILNNSINAQHSYWFWIQCIEYSKRRMAILEKGSLTIYIHNQISDDKSYIFSKTMGLKTNQPTIGAWNKQHANFADSFFFFIVTDVENSFVNLIEFCEDIWYFIVQICEMIPLFMWNDHIEMLIKFKVNSPKRYKQKRERERVRAWR